MLISSKYIKNYIIFLIANVFEESTVSQHIVFILIVANYSLRVSDHVVVNIKMVPYKVAGEEKTYSERYPALERSCIEVQPFHHHG